MNREHPYSIYVELTYLMLYVIIERASLEINKDARILIAHHLDDVFYEETALFHDALLLS
jgi:hypothetical protein